MEDLKRSGSSPMDVQMRSIDRKVAGLIRFCPCKPRAAVTVATEPIPAAAATWT